MPGISSTSRKLIELARTLHKWLSRLLALDASRRARVAMYADNIAETLSRAAHALDKLHNGPGDRSAGRAATLELARIAGYMDTIVQVLDDQLDGRKLAGVKRRLERIDAGVRAIGTDGTSLEARINRLTVAEGYFRALADALRT